MLPLVEELNALNDVTAYYVETMPLPDSFKRGGFVEYSDRYYIIRTWRNEYEWDKAMELAMNADVMIIGASEVPKIFERKRLKKNLLTFEHSERPLKKGLYNLLSPRILNSQFHYHFLFRQKPLYMLCFSAFTAFDEYRLRAFEDKCYKFAYLTRIEQINACRRIRERDNKVVKLVWCARFISWKHPELVIELAERLVNSGYEFEINMIGSGKLFAKVQRMVHNKQLESRVHLLGNFPNSEVLKIMAQHHVFLFTSDKQEGWGAVLNEAMGQVCCPVVSNKIGSAPYLMQHIRNGLVFNSNDIESLYLNVKFLLDNPNLINEYALNAYNTVANIWNPKVVAKRFCELCSNLLSGNDTPFADGPCSKALPSDVL